MAFDDTLAAWLRKQPALPSLQKVAYIVRRAADAIQQLHHRQIVHQDINLASFIIHAAGENAEQFDIQLADIGATARAPSTFGRTFPANSQLAYMAPEQWVGQAVFATDQYALAAMACELLTGVPPFQGPPARLMDSHFNVQPPAPSTLNQRVSPAVDVVMQSALAKRPEDRFPSVSAFASALEQAIRRPETLIVSVPKTTFDGNLRATLPISSVEASTGTLRTITLPQGRRVLMAVPKGAYDGQVIQLEGFGDSSALGGPAGAVLLTIAITSTETNISTTGPTRQTSLTGSTQLVIEPPSPVASTGTNPRAIVNRAYTAFATLPPRRRNVALGILTSVLLILILLGVSLSSILQSNASGPIPYPPHSGSLALNDLLRDNSAGSNWPQGTNSNGSMCQFAQGAYHVSVTQIGSFHFCTEGATGFGNFAYEVRMTIIRGDEGGIVFRADGAKGTLYYFKITRDGSYGLYRYVDATGTHAQTLVSDVTAAIRTGLNIPNLLAVVARGNTITLYVNDQQIASVSNSAYANGQVGVAAASVTDPTEVIFSSAKVWNI